MKKTLITIVATVLVCACIVGGTAAWLMDKTAAVTNTFTVGNISITLTETNPAGGTLNATTAAAEASYTVIPGKTCSKDPLVTVEAGSEACWLFVQITETNNLYNGTTKYMTYNVADGWILVDGTTNVYYREVNKVDTNTSFYVLKGDATYANGVVTMNSSVTGTMITALGANKPTIAFSAYAVQKEAATSAPGAWDLAQDNANY